MSDNNDFTHELVIYNSDENSGTMGTGRFLLYDDDINALKVADLENLKIGGGEDGQVLMTDGAGNLTWVSGSSGNATNWNPNPTYTTTPSTSWFGWSFPNAGDGSTYLIQDVNNQRFYRVHLMIGPGYTKNFISIERLL